MSKPTKNMKTRNKTPKEKAIEWLTQQELLLKKANIDMKIELGVLRTRVSQAKVFLEDFKAINDKNNITKSIEAIKAGKNKIKEIKNKIKENKDKISIFREKKKKVTMNELVPVKNKNGYVFKSRDE